MIRTAGLRLLRSSSFRLALQSAALSAAGAFVVFGIIYHAALGTVRAELDMTVAGEKADIISDIQDNHNIIAQTINDAIAESSGTFYALTGSAGEFIAGNLRIPPPVAARWTGWRTLDKQDGIALPPHVAEIRGLAMKLANGDNLYVAENASSLHALTHLIAKTFLAVFGTILAIGLAGGLLVARASLRRVEAISDTSREIMEGDLSRRIALTGKADEFDRLAVNLNTMFDRIQNLMQNLQQVSNDIAHDLRSPLGRLREHLELARRDAADARTQLAFEEAIAQVDSALAIFAAMLRIAEVEAGARRRDFTAINVSEMLSDLTETFEPVAEAAGSSLISRIEAGLKVFGDRELLTQMLVNLIENAIRHTPPGSRIVMRAQPAGRNDIEMIISDNGHGIPPQEHARVLQRFVRLDASRHTAGSGLGLALVKAVVELHGGTIKLLNADPGLKIALQFRRLSAS